MNEANFKYNIGDKVKIKKSAVDVDIWKEDIGKVGIIIMRYYRLFYKWYKIKLENEDMQYDLREIDLEKVVK